MAARLCFRPVVFVEIDGSHQLLGLLCCLSVELKAFCEDTYILRPENEGNFLAVFSVCAKVLIGPNSNPHYPFNQFHFAVRPPR